MVTLPDIRWGRRDIKTVMLLAPSLAKEEATARGASDAWLVEDGYVTEGSSNNAYIVTMDGTIVTRNLSNAILHGITRKAVLQLAAQENYKIEERAFTPEEAYEASEAFYTSASSFVMPVIKSRDCSQRHGVQGPVGSKMHTAWSAMAHTSAE